MEEGDAVGCALVSSVGEEGVGFCCAGLGTLLYDMVIVLRSRHVALQVRLSVLSYADLVDVQYTCLSNHGRREGFRNVNVVYVRSE